MADEIDRLDERIDAVGMICATIVLSLKDRDREAFDAIIRMLLDNLKSPSVPTFREMHPVRYAEISRFLGLFGVVDIAAGKP